VRRELTGNAKSEPPEETGWRALTAQVCALLWRADRSGDLDAVAADVVVLMPRVAAAQALHVLYAQGWDN
jgi:hypothetical protein